MTAELPTGTVTFLFTDIEGSTVRWERSPDQMTTALAQHDAILRSELAACGGVLCQTAGDSFVIGFESAPAALEMALRAQRALRSESWPPDIGPLRVRMALHTGQATQRGDHYDANHTLTRQARLLSTAHAEQILVSGVTAPLLFDRPPDGTTLRDLGELWLKDLIEPERVFQVVATRAPWSLPSEFPPLRSQRPAPGNLPTSPTPFVGRASALDDIAQAITEGPLRLTTLVGPGGIGKTRLALRSAERVQHHFADGVFFVDLSAVTETELVIPTIAAVLGLADADEPRAALAGYLRERDLLLVLDNLEQVIEAALDVAELLAAAPTLRVLATSRIPLHIQSEFEYGVASLELPGLDGQADVAAVADSEAIELFVQRATVADPTFALTDDNARTIATICHRLDGIPLAIVLAAARLRIMTPETMLEGLDDRLGLLTGGARDLPARHQTLRATIEWSHELLDEIQQAQYAHWSVFVGGFRAEAAAAVDPSAADASAAGLKQLVDSSLLTAVTTPKGEIRYRMLETIGEHAFEKLQAVGADADAQDAHARFFLSVAEEAAQFLEGVDVVSWTEHLEEEHDNLRAALSTGFARASSGGADEASSVIRLAAALALFWHDRSHFTEGRRHLEAAIGLVPVWVDGARDENERRRALTASASMSDYLGTMARRRGEMDEARRVLHDALSTYRSLDDDRGQGRVLAALGNAEFHEGDIEGARAAQTLSLDFARAAGDDFTVVTGLLSLGNTERNAGNAEEARSFYDQALEVSIDIHDLIGESVALNNKANLSITSENAEEVRELHLRSLDIRHEVRHRIMIAESMVGLAAVDVVVGRARSAARLLGFAEALAEELGATFDPEEQRIHDRSIDAIETKVGAAALADERAVGRGMTLEAAMHHARSAEDA